MTLTALWKEGSLKFGGNNRGYTDNEDEYGVTEPPWPGRTILIYNLGNNWTRPVNIPGRHAELVLIDQIQREINARNADTDPVETVNIEVYISYSPCRNCSNELIQIFGAYQKSFNLVFKIYYSNLYLYPQERDGLVNLLNRGVDLQPVIGEDMWKDFLLANGYTDNEDEYDVTEPPWPRRTILIYNLGNNWTRPDNIPGRHAELVLIDQIQRELNARNADTDPVETVNIEVYISYSPCRNCSNELIQIFGAYQKSFNLVFKIYYSNLCLYPQERDGLVNLLNRGVDLQPVIGEDMWKDFLLAN
ncbi:hypothetical protein DPMN_047344, partial [Dreissena polymorpha]